MVDLFERLNVLLKQERTVYHCKDYLSPSIQRKLQEQCSDTHVPKLPCSASLSSSSSSSGINEVWREKICEWSYQVVDHFDFSREVVGISISFLDRYLCTRSVDKKLFQLAAMTTLYLAIKIYEPGTLSMASMIELSRGYFMVEQMATMEMAILQALSWHIHPPTTFCLARHFLHMLPASPTCSSSARHDILELARFLTELSVIDYFFVTRRASSTALAALLNAMDTVGTVECSIRMDFVQQLKRLDGFDPFDLEIEECRVRLRELYTQGGYSRPEETQQQDEEEQQQGQSVETRTETISPVCVAAAFEPQKPTVADSMKTEYASSDPTYHGTTDGYNLTEGA